MNVQIFEKNVALSPAQRELVARQLQVALERFDSKIRRMIVSFCDINGPRGGRDKLCRLRLWISGKREIVLSENGTSVESAISRIADRAAHKIGRTIERRRLYQTNDSIRRSIAAHIP